MKKSYLLNNKVLAKIYGHGRGYVFSRDDFAGIGTRAAIAQSLARLVLKGIIRRICRGLYHYPKYNPVLGGALDPTTDAAAQAVARKTKSRIIPSGALAANVLGLSTQVPSKMVYLTDGPQRTVKIGKQILIFKHASPRTMAVSGRTTAIVFQALKYIGQKNINRKVIQQLKNTLSEKDRKKLRNDMIYATIWMKPILQEIVGER